MKREPGHLREYEYYIAVSRGSQMPFLRIIESRINSEPRANIESPALRLSMREPWGHCLREHEYPRSHEIDHADSCLPLSNLV
jgi:hypothetical protein